MIPADLPVGEACRAGLVGFGVTLDVGDASSILRGSELGEGVSLTWLGMNEQLPVGTSHQDLVPGAAPSQ